MRYAVVGLVGLLSLWAASAASAGTPGEPPPAVSWRNLAEAASQAYTEGPGELGAWRARGLAAGARVVPGRLRGLDIELEAEVPVSGASESFGELALGAVLEVELGRRAGTARDALGARLVAERARTEADRLAFVQAVRAAYLDWWIEYEIQEHVRGHIAEVDAEIALLDELAARGTISRVDLLDLHVEAAEVAAELAAAQRAAADAAARVVALLGRDVRLVADLKRPPGCTPEFGDNPWGAALASAERHPELVALERAAAAASAEAAAADAGAPPALGVGLRARRERDGAVSVGGLVALSVPFGNESAPARELQAAEGRGLERERRWAARRLRAQLQAEERRWEAGVRYVSDVGGRLCRTFRERQRLLSEAVSRGQVTRERVIRSRREMYAARHELLRHIAGMFAERARAEELGRWLERAPSGAE